MVQVPWGDTSSCSSDTGEFILEGKCVTVDESKQDSTDLIVWTRNIQQESSSWGV